MIPPSALDSLRALFRPDQIVTEAIDTIPYACDGTAMLREVPQVVVFPDNTAEVVQLVLWASATRTPLVTRGSGSGLSGGSVPTPDCVVVCLLKLNQIHELDSANLTLLCDAGCITQAIADAAQKVGLLYPPDPSSLKISTIGGNIANNSGGLRGLKYGVTRNYVMGLEVVLASGEVVWMGNKCVKDVAGYSLKDLFIGSEGTLGIITKVLLRLIPQPAARRTLLASFTRIEDAAETVSAFIAAHIIPCTLEFLDQTTMRCVEDYARIGLPTEAGALLLMETDGPAAVVDSEARQMEQIARQHHALNVTTAADAEEGVRLATARRSAFSALARIKPTTVLEDVTVPRSALAVMVRAVEEIAQRHRLTIANFGHMGDGNLHPTILTDERNPEEIRRVHLAMHEIFVKAIELGGTITGEHGVGLAKKAEMKLQFSDASIALHQSLKHALDPLGLFNPGKMFAPAAASTAAR
jgi:glycolate oxidase